MTTCLTRRVPAAAPGPSALSKPATPERSAEEEQQGQASNGELDLRLSGNASVQTFPRQRRLNTSTA